MNDRWPDTLTVLTVEPFLLTIQRTARQDRRRRINGLEE
jgi:hypothetical protein